MGRLALILVCLSVILTSTLAIRFTNPDSQGRELGQCLDRCDRLRFSSEMQRECRKQCQEEVGGEGRRERPGGDELVELMINPRHHGGDEQKYEECRRDCPSQGQRGESEQWQCQRRCQEKYQRQERDGEDEDDNQGREISRKCQQICRGKGYECQRRCIQRERHDEDEDDNQGREISRKCQQMCRGRGYECQRRCMQRERQDEDEDDNQGREISRKCQQMCRGKGYECQRRCMQRERQDEDDNQGRQISRKCQQMCRGKGYECQRRCMQSEEDNNQASDPQQLAECQERCLRKGGGVECLGICIQESMGHGGGRKSPQTTLLASILDFTRLFD